MLPPTTCAIAYAIPSANPKGFRPKARRLRVRELPWVRAPNRLQPQRGCGPNHMVPFAILAQNFPLSVAAMGTWVGRCRRSAVCLKPQHSARFATLCR